MDISAISIGPNPPKDIHAVIEIPLGGAPVKYELDKASGALRVDRFLHTAMFYPGNYGFIPHTLSADGDPCDVLVVSQVQVVPGAIVRCRPVGALMMEDEAGGDEKIIAVPVDALAPFYSNIRSYRDLPPIMCEQIAHFFQHYKDLEKGKWVTIARREGRRKARARRDCARRQAASGEKSHAKCRTSVSPASRPPTESATERMT